MAGKWTWYLCDRTGAKLDDISDLIQNPRLSLRLNRPQRLEFDIKSDRPEVATLSGGLPYLRPMNSIKGWRDGVQRVSSYIWLVSDKGEAEEFRTNVVAMDPLVMLEKRWVRNANNAFKIAVAFTNTLPKDILRNLITRTTTGVATPGLALGTHTSNGTETATDAIYELRTIWSVFEELGGTGVDFWAEPQDTTDSNLCNLDSWTFRGGTIASASRPNLVLGWGLPPYNVETIERNLDAGTMANSLRVYGGDAVRKLATGSDGTSQGIYGIHEAVENYPDITVQSYINAIESYELALRKNPREIVNVKPLSGAVEPFVDFDLGDTFNIYCSSKLRGGFSGIQRVYGFDLSITAGVERIDTLYTSPV